MTHQCPVCQRSFDEPGFCPFDGKQLVPLDLAQKATVVSEMMRAADEPTIGEANQIRAISAAQQSTQQILSSFNRGPTEYDRLVGETLDGRYFIQRKIGEGGMGVVYAARHAVIERPLAIKVLKRDVMRDAATIKRFVQEARAASRIGHPNIVDVTDFGTTPDGMTYSVMEYVDGITLAKAIRAEAPMLPERSISIASQIARALAAAHDKGIIHRDLKPENVFLIQRDDRPDFVKIVDFGIAKVLPIEGADPNAPKLTRAGSVFGTPEYMAPEQASGRGDIDGRVDVYALGTILYEMTCGRTPHRSNSTVRTIAMQMLDPIPPFASVNPDLVVHPAFERVIMKALAKQREDRFATMAELGQAFDAVLAELAQPAPTLSLPPVPPGADPIASPAIAGRAAAPEALRSRMPEPAKPRRSKGETRPLHEPEFVATPITVLPEPTFDEPPVESRRWPIAAATFVLLAAGGGAVWYASRPSPISQPAIGDAEIVRIPTPASDGSVIVEADDASPVPADGRAVVLVGPDGGVPDPTLLTPHPDSVTIEVLTRPGDANVFTGRTFLGPSGAKIDRPWGTKLSVECRAPHLKGRVDLVFDGAHTSMMCTAIRLPMCVHGLKNPYDECEP